MDELRMQTDETLLRMYMEGDNGAFDVLLKRYETKVFSYLVYSVHSQEVAEDLFQDAFMPGSCIGCFNHSCVRMSQQISHDGTTHAALF